MPLPRLLDVASSMFTTVSRLGAGVQARRPAHRPAQPLELYEFEGCPFCRKVRDALTELDLEAMIYPCPPGGGGPGFLPSGPPAPASSMLASAFRPTGGTRAHASRQPAKPLELWSFE